MNVKQLAKTLKRISDNGLGHVPVAFRMDDFNATEISNCLPVALPQPDNKPPIKVVLLIGTMYTPEQIGKIKQVMEKQNDVQQMATDEVRQTEENQTTPGLGGGHSSGQAVPQGDSSVGVPTDLS